MRANKPHTVWLTVNRRCNLRCSWCYAGGTGYSAKKEMSLNSAEQLLTVAMEAGVKHVIVIGGEPTLWKPLSDFNKFCADKGINSTLVTNGIRFGEDNYWHNYLKSPNDHVGLSVKAASASQLLQVASARNFNLAEMGAKRAILECGATPSITYNSFYADSLVEMVQWLVSCGAKMVKIDFCSTLFKDGMPVSDRMMPPSVLARNIIRDYPKLNNITNGNLAFEMMMPLCLWPKDFIENLISRRQIMSVCHVHKGNGLIFDENGGILACNATFDYPMGHFGRDFFDGNSLLEWLNSDAIKNCYNRLRCYPAQACQVCEMYNECAGGCPLRWAVYKPDEIVKPFIKNKNNERRW